MLYQLFCSRFKDLLLLCDVFNISKDNKKLFSQFALWVWLCLYLHLKKTHFNEYMAPIHQQESSITSARPLETIIYRLLFKKETLITTGGKLNVLWKYKYA